MERNEEVKVVGKGLLNNAKSKCAESCHVRKALSENEIKTSDIMQIEIQLGFRISKRLTT